VASQEAFDVRTPRSSSPPLFPQIFKVFSPLPRTPRNFDDPILWTLFFDSPLIRIFQAPKFPQHTFFCVSFFCVLKSCRPLSLLSGRVAVPFPFFFEHSLDFFFPTRSATAGCLSFVLPSGFFFPFPFRFSSPVCTLPAFFNLPASLRGSIVRCGLPSRVPPCALGPCPVFPLCSTLLCPWRKTSFPPAPVTPPSRIPSFPQNKEEYVPAFFFVFPCLLEGPLVDSAVLRKFFLLVPRRPLTLRSLDETLPPFFAFRNVFS